MTHTGQRVGYVRVSSVDQNTARQLDGENIDRTFIDKLSGKDTKRPQFEAMMQYVREGDTVIAHSLDRLCRSLVDLERTVTELNDRGVKVEFLHPQAVYTGDDSPTQVLQRQILASVAQFERAIIRERQREGIAIAKREGVYKGRLPALTAEKATLLRQRVAKQDPKAAIARDLGISRATLYAYLREDNRTVRA